MSLADPGITYREADARDVPAMAECRIADATAGPADERMAAYFAGRHYPQRALAPRTGYVAILDGSIIGYIAGHLTERFDCQGEVQYLYVTPACRRQGVARGLLQRLATWFVEQRARRICVNVNPESPGARPFYMSLSATDLRPQWMEWRDIETAIHPRQPSQIRPRT